MIASRAAALLVVSLAQRQAPPVMGGFEQKNYGKGGARLSLLVTGASLTPDALPQLCTGKGLTGVIYGLSGGRVEVVAEGERAQIEELVEQVRASAGEAASMREAWQLPVGGYVDSFPVVTFDASKMQANVRMMGNEGDLDYITRHLRIEAVFNRGLKLRKSRIGPERMDLEVSGDSGRLKSFVRWCYQGPPLARPDEVQVEWSAP